MKIKCPKCKSDNLNITKSIFQKLPIAKTLLIVFILISIWNIISAIYGQYHYTCTNCGKKFK